MAQASGRRSLTSALVERSASWSSTSRRYDHGLRRCRVALAQTLRSTEAVFNPASPPTCNQVPRLCGSPHKRRTWLFYGSETGGHTAAVLTSFTATCKRLGINSWLYLKDVLTRLPACPPEQLPMLLPNTWAKAQIATHQETLSR
jgi:hypothetical protein